MEEEGVREGGEKLRAAQMADKAGWIKKSSGGLLGLWKDRYLLLCKAQLLVYENEDDQNCIETVELGSYEKCQDYRALLKKKHRFILLRSPGNKAHDIKFQAQNGEEKDSWIKALNEGINKGKNKAFDEVKVDKSCALEHVTRHRVKGGQRRRPPTRIHLKEVASAASDGMLRLDLDVPDSRPPSFTSSNNISDAPPKEIPRPPMPPSKPSQDPEKPNLEDIAEKPETEESVPTPIADNPQHHPEHQGMSEINEENLETSALPEGSKENLSEGNKSLENPPEPPPKVQPDKLKVSWENPSPHPPTPVGKESDRPTSSETASKEGGKPPTPPPKILSEKLKASLKRSETTSQDQCQDSQASKTPNPDPGSSHVSVNGMTDSANGAEPILESSLQRAVEDRGDQKTPLKKDKGQLAPSEPSIPSLEGMGAREGSGVPRIQDGSPVLPSLQPRCTSLGNLLTESDKGQGLPLDRHQLFKIEKKVTSEREKTEQLLSQVLGKELEHAQEGNGPPVNPETLLNQAVEQLRQATQVLQEIKVLGELNKEPSTTLTEKQKEKQKDLVTLYRRSAP